MHFRQVTRIGLVGSLLLCGCQKSETDAWQGYVEGEFVMLASPRAGVLRKLHVRRGDAIEAGKPVFILEQEVERGARQEAEERVRTAEAQLANLQAPRRSQEVAALREALNQAKAALELSRANLAREQELFRKGFSPQARVDDARTTRERDEARVKQAQAQLNDAMVPVGREDERKAAEGALGAARAALAQTSARLDQMSVVAPVTGLVQDTFYAEGEWVAAGKPVASLLPPGNVKARFYVPETVVSSIPIGRAVEIACDGCQPIGARVSYVSSQAEYTPPVLYSKESRSKLMFLVEARLPRAELRPGQPIDVRLK
jgi:HlyD family secretion protein